MQGEDIASTSRSSYGNGKSSKMHNCGFCFLWSCYSSKDLVMSYVSNVVEKVKKCIMLIKLRCKFRFSGPGGAAPDQTSQSRPVKKTAYAFFLRVGFAGSASAAVCAGPQRHFSANCKHVLRAGQMRGLLELL